MTDTQISENIRWWVISAALLALFLGAMDSLIMSAAMPTIVADLGGLSAYSWVYTAYFLARVVALPVFGKLSDLYPVKRLFIVSIGLFLVSSIAAGVSPNMVSLIIARVFQGIAAGGNFALVYVVLSDMAPPGKRAKTLSLASFTWGLASILGPTIGGVIFVIGLGMGFVSMSTLLVVQGALDESNLGVATTSNQFARSLGGTIGIGVGGGVVISRIQIIIDNLGQLSVEMVALLRNNIERLFQPEFQSQISMEIQKVLQRSVGESVVLVFWIAFIVSWLCLAACLYLPGRFSLVPKD